MCGCANEKRKTLAHFHIQNSHIKKWIYIVAGISNIFNPISIRLYRPGKAIYIQQVQGKYWLDVQNLHVRYEALHAERGTIYSEDGNMLSTSIPEFDVYIDFAADGLREKNGKRFIENYISYPSIWLIFLKIKKHDYKKELQNAYNKEDRYYVLQRKINFQQYITLSKFLLVRMGNKSGFIISMHTKRLNPFKLLANRTIGLLEKMHKM